MSDESSLPVAPLLTFDRFPAMPWRCPKCHSLNQTSLGWGEMADIINGGTMEAICDGCDADVELSGVEVVE